MTLPLTRLVVVLPSLTCRAAVQFCFGALWALLLLRLPRFGLGEGWERYSALASFLLFASKWNRIYDCSGLLKDCNEMRMTRGMPNHQMHRTATTRCGFECVGFFGRWIRSQSPFQWRSVIWVVRHERHTSSIQATPPGRWSCRRVCSLRGSGPRLMADTRLHALRVSPGIASPGIRLRAVLVWTLLPMEHAPAIVGRRVVRSLARTRIHAHRHLHTPRVFCRTIRCTEPPHRAVVSSASG